MPPVLRRRAAELLGSLPAPMLALLDTTARIAGERGWRAALVGGSVRDMALDVPLDHDLDVVVEGDAVALAETIALACGGRLAASHAAFGTATVLLTATSMSLALDLASARTETYAHPAALPTVAPATLEADLARRDFSINALAIELGRGDAVSEARVHDPYGGMDDLVGGVLRVLHTRSFEDDPTRIVRGLRLATRLGLRFETGTRALLAEALAQEMLERTSPDRIRSELCLALEESRPEAVLALGDELGITPHVVPFLSATPSLLEWMKRSRVLQVPPSVTRADLALGLLTYDLSSAERTALIERYRLPSAAARLLQEVAAIQGRRTHLADPTLTNSHLDHLLHPFTLAALTVVRVAESPAVAAAISHYLNDLRPIPPLLNGRDLLALGMSPGPRVGALLAELRAALLDGAVHTREDGLAWVSAALLSQ